MIESEDFEVPFQVYTSIRENYGDLFFQLFEVSVTSDNMGKSISKILNLVRSVDDEEHENINGRNPSDWRPVKSLPRFQSMFSSSDEPQANIYLRAFKNLYQYVPIIMPDVISKIAGNDAENVLKNLLSGVQVHATKYLQPINLEFILPTEIGLPLKGEVSMPTVNLGEADVKLVAPGLQNPTLKDLLKHDNLSLRFKSNYKYSSELFVKTETLSPWNLKVAKAVVSNYEEMNLPFYGDFSLVRSNEIKNVSLSVSPHIQQKFTVFHQHNVPFTKIGKFVPSSDFTPQYKVVGVEKDSKPALKVRKQLDQSYSGISSEMSYSGDVPYPFTTAFLLDYLRKPEQQGKLLISPVTKQWQYSLSWDPSSSESRNVTLAVSYVNAQPSPDASKGIPDFSVLDDPQERLQKIKEISTGSKVYGLNTQLFFNSPNFRRYEAIVAFTKNIRPVHPPQNAYRIVSAVLTSKIPGHFDSPKALCSDMQMLTPIVYDLNSFKRIVQYHPEKHLSAQIYYGNSCKSSQIAKTQGSLKLSDERQILVSDELEKVCNHDSKDPAFELQTAAVYDVGTLDIEFLMEKIPISLLNATYSLKEFMEGSLFPHGNYNNMYSGQPNKITVEARRPVSSSKYSFSVATPQKHSIFSEIQVPYFATKIVPFTGLQTSYDNVTDSLLLSLDITPKCTIKKGLITTFDYVKYEFKPVAGTAQCWAIATRDNADNTKTPLYTVRIRQNAEGLQEAQITPDSESPHVEFTYKQAFINGKEMPPDKIIENVNDEDGYPIMTVSKIKDGYKVNLFYTLTTVITSSAIEIFPGYGMRHAVIGLCGDYDRKRDNDKTGPKGCLYTDDQLFEYSWTSSEGDGCDQKQEEQMQTQVKNYQKTCPKRRNPSSKLDITNIYQSTVDDCTRNVYPVQKKGPSWCAAYEPTLKCKSGCVQVNSKPKKVKAGCWPREKIPEDVSAGEIIGYITNPPAEKAPVNVILALEEAKYCIKLKH
ncbi:Hemolymph clottable protein [Armadillidium vulgare]|nr:Hemolymph clottable protein [Armadillidium vulgare]